MSWSGCMRTAAFALAIIGFSAPPVEAVEFIGGAGPASQMSDGLLTQVRAVRHGGGHRGGARPGGGHRPGGGAADQSIVPAAANGPRSIGRLSTVRVIARRSTGRPAIARAAQCIGPAIAHPSTGRSVIRERRRRSAHGLDRPSRLVSLEPRRRHRGRRGDRLCGGGGRDLGGPPPQPGLCWYYTDPSRRQGFWDACP